MRNLLPAIIFIVFANIAHATLIEGTIIGQVLDVPRTNSTGYGDFTGDTSNTFGETADLIGDRIEIDFRINTDLLSVNRPTYGLEIGGDGFYPHSGIYTVTVNGHSRSMTAVNMLMMESSASRYELTVWDTTPVNGYYINRYVSTGIYCYCNARMTPFDLFAQHGYVETNADDSSLMSWGHFAYNWLGGAPSTALANTLDPIPPDVSMAFKVNSWTLDASPSPTGGQTAHWPDGSIYNSNFDLSSAIYASGGNGSSPGGSNAGGGGNNGGGTVITPGGGAGVPELDTWALISLGIGISAGLIRYKRSIYVTVSNIALI